MKKLNLFRSVSPVFFFAGAVCILLTSYLLIKIRACALPHAGFYSALSVFLLFWFFLFLFLAYRKKEQGAPLWKIYILLSIGLSLPVSLFFLPSSVPDELTHYQNAIRASNFLIFREPLTEDYEEAVFMTELFNAGPYLTPEFYEAVASWLSPFRKTSELAPLYIAIPGTSVPLGYIFSSAGIALGHLLRLSPLYSLYLGRFFNALAFTALTALSIHWIPYGKRALMAIALFPMTVQLAASLSYDMVVIAATFLLVSYILKLCCQKERITLKQEGLCLLFCLILAPCKICVYYPLLALVLLIPKKNFGKPARKWIFTALCLTLSAALIILLQRSSFASRVSDYSAQDYYSVSYVLANPGEGIRLLISDLWLNLDKYIKTAVDQNLGWFYLSGYDWMTALFLILFAAGALPSSKEPKPAVTVSERLLLLFAAACSFGMILLTFLTATPLTSPVIEGVQGRYLTPLFILLIPVLQNKAVTLSDRLLESVPFTVCGLSFLTVLLLALSIL